MLITFYCLWCQPLNELCLLFFLMVNQYTVKWFIRLQSSDPLNQTEPCPKLPQMGTSLKHRGDGQKLRQKTDSNRPCQPSTPRFKSDTCCCSFASKAPGNQEVCYHVVKVALSLPNKLKPHPPLSIVLPRFLRLTAPPLCHLSSIHSICVLFLPVCL